jgi:hypothetical protein
MDYTPDKWVIIKITNKATEDVHYRVFATWYGGYTGSDSWKMNSGIVSAIKREDGCFEFFGESGSVYFCHENCWGTSGYGHGVLEYYMKNTEQAEIEVLPEDTDILSIKYKWSCTK